MADTAVRDPMGHSLRLADAAWYGHVVKRHPGMRPLRRLVELALQEPWVVRRSQQDAECLLYYMRHPSRSALLICVVANVADGDVRTAYLAKDVAGGEQVWP